jgi:hypothetical protein
MLDRQTLLIAEHGVMFGLRFSPSKFYIPAGLENTGAGAKAEVVRVATRATRSVKRADKRAMVTSDVWVPTSGGEFSSMRHFQGIWNHNNHACATTAKRRRRKKAYSVVPRPLKLIIAST